MSSFTPGPSYGEMLQPSRLPAAVRRQALDARGRDELDPINLHNITWRDARDRVRHVVLPRALTGIEANIIVLLGCDFPSGSHKVGPAYVTLMEGELSGEIDPAHSRIIGPSTGNFGIGVAYIARLMGYPAVVVMPEGMSAERYQRVRQYGGELDLTPGSESDVILVLERTRHYRKDPRNKILAQFELLPNYRFHRYVTGGSALEVASEYGNGRIAAFVAAPGSAGTLAAGDEIKARFPDAVVCALEPRECATLYCGGRGTHRIEGIGDKMVTLIHNVLTTDYVALIHDEDCLRGLRLLQESSRLLKTPILPSAGTIDTLQGQFGISSICNIIGSIKMARLLGLGDGDNVVSIATDGFDRYPSVMADLERREGPVSDRLLLDWYERIFAGADTREILDVRPKTEKGRLFRQKEKIWVEFDYSVDYLERMESQSFWDAEYARIPGIDEACRRRR
ncbi:MAG: pyridoxal-phosphate dependent enzyme [Acidobacteriota bacterium]